MNAVLTHDFSCNKDTKETVYHWLRKNLFDHKAEQCRDEDGFIHFVECVPSINGAVTFVFNVIV